jgi:hypothetical protein
VGDVDCFQIANESLFVISSTDDFGLAGNGFRVVFCEMPSPEPIGTICVLSVLRADEPFTSVTLDILRGREIVARERLEGWIAA